MSFELNEGDARIVLLVELHLDMLDVACIRRDDQHNQIMTAGYNNPCSLCECSYTDNNVKLFGFPTKPDTQA
jgi:hypothetical protein